MNMQSLRSSPNNYLLNLKHSPPLKSEKWESWNRIKWETERKCSPLFWEKKGKKFPILWWPVSEELSSQMWKLGRRNCSNYFWWLCSTLRKFQTMAPHFYILQFFQGTYLRTKHQNFEWELSVNLQCIK